MNQSQDLLSKSRRRAERLRGETSETLADGRGLRAGDLFVEPATAKLPVEWAVLDIEAPAGDGPGSSRLLLVPADTRDFCGSRDVQLAADHPLAPLTLRCAAAVRIDALRLEGPRRQGSLPESLIEKARDLAAEPGAGEVVGSPLSREVDYDPEYRHWIDTAVRPAADALRAIRPQAPSAAQDRAEPRRPEPARSPATGLWRLAAGILLVTTAASAYWWSRSHGAVERHLSRNRQLESQLADRQGELDRIQARYGELEERASEREAELRAELDESRRTHEAAANASRLRIGSLERQLAEARVPRPRVNVPILLLRPTERSPPSPELAGQDSDLIVFNLLVGTEPFDRYRLEIFREGAAEPLWSTDGLTPNADSLLSFQLPSLTLGSGLFVGRLVGLREGQPEGKVTEYPFAIGEAE